jgi:hypothetical protein
MVWKLEKESVVPVSSFEFFFLSSTSFNQLGKLHGNVLTWCEDEVSSPKCSVGYSEKLLHFCGNFTPLNYFQISDLKVYRTECVFLEDKLIKVR